jgi:hypothetical protein
MIIWAIVAAVLLGCTYIGGGITFYVQKRDDYRHRVGTARRWDVDEAIIGAFLWPKYALRALQSGVRKVRDRDQQPPEEE